MQIDSKPRHDVNVTEEDLLKIPQGPRTEACLRHNCVVGVQYLEAWLGGLGCVPLYNLMEDAATAEICRTQARPNSVLPPRLGDLPRKFWGWGDDAWWRL